MQQTFQQGNRVPFLLHFSHLFNYFVHITCTVYNHRIEALNHHQFIFCPASFESHHHFPLELHFTEEFIFQYNDIQCDESRIIFNSLDSKALHNCIAFTPALALVSIEYYLIFRLFHIGFLPIQSNSIHTWFVQKWISQCFFGGLFYRFFFPIFLQYFEVCLENFPNSSWKVVQNIDKSINKWICYLKLVHITHCIGCFNYEYGF